MAFKLSKTDTFQASVEINTQDDRGRTQKETIKVTYLRLNEAGLAELEGKTNADVCREVIFDLIGLVDDDNQAVPWNDFNKEALLAIPPATYAIASKFWMLSRVGREK